MRPVADGPLASTLAAAHAHGVGVAIGVPDGPGWVSAQHLARDPDRLRGALERAGTALGITRADIGATRLCEVWTWNLAAAAAATLLLDGRLPDLRAANVALRLTGDPSGWAVALVDGRFRALHWRAPDARGARADPGVSADAKRIFRELQSLAHADYGGNTGNLLVVYAVEGFLRRLAASDYAANMTLKGGMLMAAMASRRMTKDADLSAVGVSNDQARIAAVVSEILAVPLRGADGLAFDADSIRTEVMREDAEYQGVRVRVLAHLATARVTVTSTFRSATRSGQRSSICPSCWARARFAWRPTRRR